MVFFKISRLKYYDGTKMEEYKPKEEIPLYTGREMFMNRSIDDATDICLVSPIASRKHAIIVHRGDENVEIKDLNTINGTFLNGKKIKQNVWVPLKNNDVLSIGVDFYTTKKDEEKYFFKLVQVNRRCKLNANTNDMKAKPACDNSLIVNNATFKTCSPSKNLSVQNGVAADEISDSTMKTRSGNFYGNNSQELGSTENKKEDLKKRKPSSQESSEQPPVKKASLNKADVLSKEVDKQNVKQKKKTNTDQSDIKVTSSKTNVLSERNTKTSSVIRPPKILAKPKSNMEGKLCLKEPKVSAIPREKCLDKTSNLELEMQKILTDKNNGESIIPDDEPMHSTQDLLHIMDSQAVPENPPNNKTVPDFDFKMPSVRKRKCQSFESNGVSRVEETISKVFGGETSDVSNSDLDMDCNSTQDLKNILMDSQDSVEVKPITAIQLKKNASKKIFKSQVRSPSKKPKFDYSFEKFYDFESDKKETKKRNSSVSKKTTPQPSTSSRKSSISTSESTPSIKKPRSSKSINGSSGSKSEMKIKANSKPRKQKSPLQKHEETRDISVVVGEVEESQVMSQYSMTEDEIVDIVYDDYNNVATTTTSTSNVRSHDESPKFMRTSLKQVASNSLGTTLKQSKEKKRSKSKVRQVNFQSNAEQVQFDNEDTSSSVRNIQRHMIKLNTNPSLCKLQSMESQSIKHTLSGMYKNNGNAVGTYLGDNVHLLCWLCSWLPQQMTMELPPPIFKGLPIEKIPQVKQTYTNIGDFYETQEPLLYYQTWSDMFVQYIKESRRRRQLILHRDTVEYVPSSSFQSTRKKLFRLQCSIKNSISKWLQEKQILLLTFNHAGTTTSPTFECFAYITDIDKLSNNSSFDILITLNVVSEKELTFIPTSTEIIAQVMTRVDINQWKSQLGKSVNNHFAPVFLNPVNIIEPPLLRIRDSLENVGTCTLGQKHVVSTFLDVCLENNRKLVMVDALAGTGKTTSLAKAIENLLLYTNPSHHHRVLLFGSSVGSLDEISSLLINLRKSLPSQAQKKKIKFLRLDESQHAEVKTYACNEFVQSELRGFKKEALENPAMLKRRRHEILNLISKEPHKNSPYCQSLEKALKDLDSYPETKVLSKDFLLYFFKTQKRYLIDGADIVCCNLKELLNTESCNYINVNSQRKTTVCIIEDANLCTDLDLSLILQLHIDKLILIGDSTVDVILPFACLYRKNFHWNLFKRLIRAKTVSHRQTIPVIKLNQIHRGTSTLRQNIKAVFGHGGSLNGDPKSNNNVNIMDWCVIDHKLEGLADSTNDRTVRVKSCDQEATLVVNIAIEVKNKYPHLSVAIITPFDIQRSVIMKTLCNKHEDSNDIQVPSVVDFMGRQADVVIFSTKLPYALTSNVLEIVFTRARSALVIVGNFSTQFAKNSYTGYEWAKVLEISKSSRCLKTVGSDFDLTNEKLALSLILK
ncbi:hypothetical protein M8J76_007664 [Diaphorina citri]|nr:hypothetical protein M8J76_007664 [Diaphorina citri]